MVPQSRFLRFALPAFLLAVLCAASRATAADGKVDFNRDIRPILSENCFACHGPDEKRRDGDRRLDIREGAIADSDGIIAIVPGKPEESDLLIRIRSHDQDEIMPPPKAKKSPLTEQQIALITRWIAEGAEYEGHWAFLPVEDVVPPPVQDADWARNPIDQFILAKLEKEGVKPSPEADRATLIRRLSLDLTGLVPTPEEVRAFQDDARPDAYAQLVTRLLASPHYGERWGRHWLDQARYADSNGYAIDNPRAMWPYRDWVIKALNDDMPFDRFTVEQIAGDLLPKATKSQRIATAFHRNTLINEEGGTKPEQFRFESVIDRAHTTGAVWLGLTVGCAQCHTHKYDPITHREFYEFAAFFNQGEEVNNKGATVSVARGEVFGKKASPRTSNEPPAKTQAQWEQEFLARFGPDTPQPVQWTPAEYLEFDTKSNASFRLLEDNSLLGDGRGSFNDSYRVLARSKLKRIAAVRLRVLTHESLPKNGPGFAQNGNFVLTDFEASLQDEPQQFATAFADHEQPNYPAQSAIDDDPKSGWAINVKRGDSTRMNADHEAVFVFAKPVEPGDQPLEFRMHHELNEKYLIGRFSLEFSETVPARIDGKDGEILAAVRMAEGQRTEAQRKLLADAFAAETKPKSAKKDKDVNADVVDLMVMKDLEKPRPTYIALRGDYLRPDTKTGALAPGVFAAVAPALPAAQTRTRLDLAKWLIDSKNPLTPRVTMNRAWMRYFGRGLVETEEDFGTQGTPPTHPELLDWLASEFVRQGWSMKAMHRLIVTSATYRQSSHGRPDLMERDPRNLWLARQERVRLEAEIIRDAALSASGLLNPEIGGPSVHPPQPDGVYAFTQTKKTWKTDEGANRFRRALYTMFYRSAPYPLFTTFDAPDFQNVCTRRGRSNTPLQALTVANDVAFVELAQGLAARVLRELPAGGVDERLRRAFALALSREPSEREFAAIRGFYDRQVARFLAEAEQGGEEFVSPNFGNSEEPSSEGAAFVAVARLLFNTDNFISRE